MIYTQNPNLNWITVLAKLDQVEFMLYDPMGLKILVLSWKYAHKVRRVENKYKNKG